ncbi:MAG: DUF3662 and FHA domain-containing protein [Chloroflexota bacterium]
MNQAAAAGARSALEGGGTDVPNVLGRIESWLQQAVEGGARTVFRQRLQPIELAKAAARAMQQRRMVGPDGIEVPNAFSIALHPDDFAELEAVRVGLETRIARYLAEYADERSLIPMGEIVVTLHPDPAVRRRAMRVGARMTELDDGPMTRPVAPLVATALLPRVHRPDSAKAPRPASQRLVLLLEDGRHVDVTNGSVRMGRALDNDVVISDSRVSRYHAQIVREPAGPVVRDLGSTNGIAVSGRAVAEDLLTDGDRLSLGGYQIEVRLGGGSAPASRPDWR